MNRVENLDIVINAIDNTQKGFDRAKAGMADLAGSATTTAHGVRDVSRSLIKLSTVVVIARKLTNTLNKAFNASSAWIENLNLFEVTMRHNADRALEFAENISSAFHIDKNEIIEYMGLFNQMAQAMGNTRDTAYSMSQALVQLGYDIASFYNIQTGVAMEKLRAGVAGQTKPLRDIGFDITAQSLDQLLQDDLGLDFTSKVLSQQNKQLARTILMVQQGTNAWGDYAKTINTFANQQKVLIQSTQMLNRAIGDFFIGTGEKAGIATKAIIVLNGAILALISVIRTFVPELNRSGFNDLKSLTETITDSIFDLRSIFKDTFDGDELKEYIDLLDNLEVSIGIAEETGYTDPLAVYMDKLSSLVDESFEGETPLELLSVMQDLQNGIAETFREFGYGVDDAEDDLDKLRGNLLGFDEFEALQRSDAPDGLLDISDILSEKLAMEYAEYMKQWNMQMENMTSNAEKVRDAILSWLGFAQVTDEAGEMNWEFSEMTKGLRIVLGVLGILAGYTFSKLTSGILAIGKHLYSVTIGSKMLQKGLLAVAGSKVALIFLALAGIILYLYKNNEEFRESVQRLFSALKSIASVISKELREPFSRLVVAFSELGQALVPLLGILLDIVTFILIKLVNILTKLLDSKFILEAVFYMCKGLELIFIGIILLLDYISSKLNQMLMFLRGFDAWWYNYKNNFIMGAKAIGQAFKEVGQELISPFVTAYEWVMKIINALKDFSIKDIMEDVADRTSKSIRGSMLGQWLSNISFFADGGFPNRGDLFVANEAGAEMVGTFGGRTAVANNDQIVKGITQGVYQAMTSALSTQSTNAFEADVVLDGKVVGRTIFKGVYSEGIRQGKFRR